MYRTVSTVRIASLLIAGCFLLAHDVAALPVSAPVKALAKHFTKMFAKEVQQEGVEKVTQRLASITTKYGDEVLEVVKPLGPRAVNYIDDLGPEAATLMKSHGRSALVLLERNGKETVSLVKELGEEAGEVLIKQPGVGPSLVRHYPQATYSAIGDLSSDSAVRLAHVADDFASLPPAAKETFAQKLAQGGDDFVCWVWMRKKEVFTASMGAVGVISAYKIGDGVADGVQGMFPKAPDPQTSPCLWLASFAMIIGSVALLLWIFLRRPRATPVTDMVPRDSIPTTP